MHVHVFVCEFVRACPYVVPLLSLLRVHLLVH